jgi:hypothetical protein
VLGVEEEVFLESECSLGRFLRWVAEDGHLVEHVRLSYS